MRWNVLFKLWISRMCVITQPYAIVGSALNTGFPGNFPEKVGTYWAFQIKSKTSHRYLCFLNLLQWRPLFGSWPWWWCDKQTHSLCHSVKITENYSQYLPEFNQVTLVLCYVLNWVYKVFLYLEYFSSFHTVTNWRKWRLLLGLLSISS